MPIAVATLFVVAGPNGCGKSTLTRTVWPRGIEVIDPDAIARDIAGGSTGQAAREALRRRQAALVSGRTHLVETTLAGFGILGHIEAARLKGFRIELHYVFVNSPEQAINRVHNRVALGGHDVAEQDVRRRFARSLANLAAAIVRSDEILLYDNADPSVPHREVAVFRAGTWWCVDPLPDWLAPVFARISSLRR